MKIIKTIFVYLKYLSFIIFLYAGTIIYPKMNSSKLGIICLICYFIYIIFTFLMLFIKNKKENEHIFNNIVAIILHIYILIIAIKFDNYYNINMLIPNFFNINYIILSISMLMLTTNKFILLKQKNTK